MHDLYIQASTLAFLSVGSEHTLEDERQCGHHIYAHISTPVRYVNIATICLHAQSSYNVYCFFCFFFNLK